jgi:basic membrane protein A
MRHFIKLAGAVALATALSVSAQAADKLKVGFIYVGPVGDFGYSYQHNQGRLAVEKALGDKVTTTFLENVPEPDSDRAIEQLVRTGHKLIFTTSFGYMEPTLKVAAKYPNVHFEHATGYKRAKNVATYSAKFHEGRYVQGVIAGKMTKSNIIGYVASFPIPEVVSGINAFMLGAQSVNPNIKVKIVWASTWFDPGKEADAAKALLDQGADIITQHTDSPAPLQQAEARGKLAFGQASDMIRFAPKTTLTSIVDNWNDYYIARVKAELDGKWKSEDTWGGFAANMVNMAPFTNMPDDVKTLATETEQAIKSGKLNPFKCPVYGQDGKEIECKGKGALDDGQVLGMNFYVKGIDDTLPK